MPAYLGLDELAPFAGVLDEVIAALDEKGKEVAEDAICMMEDGRSFADLSQMHQKVVAYLYAMVWKAARLHRMLAEAALKATEKQIKGFMEATGKNFFIVNNVVKMQIHEDGRFSAIPESN